MGGERHQIGGFNHQSDARCCLYDSTHAQFYRSYTESGRTVDVPDARDHIHREPQPPQAVNIKHPSV